MNDSAPPASTPRPRRDYSLLLACLVLSALVLVFDLNMPLGVAVPILYVPIVLLSLATPRRRLTLQTALLCTTATFAGWWASPEGGEAWKVAINRFGALLVIWAVAALAWIHKIREREIAHLHAEQEAARSQADMQQARLDAVADTLRAVHDIFNNFLNNMRWFRMEVEDHPERAAEQAREMDALIDATADELRRLDPAHDSKPHAGPDPPRDPQGRAAPAPA